MGSIRHPSQSAADASGLGANATILYNRRSAFSLSQGDMTPDDQLCERCARFDLDTISSRDTVHRMCGEMIAILGLVDKSWKERACAFCRLIGSLMVNYPSKKTLGVSAMPVQWMVAYAVPGVGAAFLGLHEYGSGVGSSHWQPCSIGRITPQDQLSEIRSDLMQRMLMHCSLNHRVSCSLSRQDIDRGIPFLSLIDCRNRTIVTPNLMPMPRFTALSYVWGSSGSGPSQPRDYTQLGNADQVIKDAISATLRLGYDYLWVDRYCITQEGNEHKHEQIQNMHRVYRQAEVTLIAAAGKDSHHGLPSVSLTPRAPQPCARINGAVYVSTLRPPPELIDKSVWATRGWAYQEAILLRRRLYFTDEQVYFDCKAMACREAIVPNLCTRPREISVHDAQYPHSLFRHIKAYNLVIRP
ncbi:HET-domain-containing protein [Mytilinidion resinicola]|uniref:HET-domain-containing protein n=1 Tax=Mytilinidion resinicola TaxID=574789 RepID=A0A6A6YG78_9PEZI|nr:HET-domain-containing protein [Mytilinidion resinicola]KAF2807578.1 HET-domain-containing protein [Mytilinidion resinicola]